jgi:hypothetical protein
MINFIAKFAAIGFAVAIVGAVLGLDGASAADLAFCRRSGCGLPFSWSFRMRLSVARYSN